MSWKELLSRNYKQIIYLSLFVSLAIPLMRPIGLPVPVDKTTQDVYDRIQALQPGDVAVLGSNIGAAIYAEVYPQYVAILEHLLRKQDVKILLVDHGTEGPIFTKKALNEVNAYTRKTYGEDFVHLGFIAGGEAAIAGLSRDIKALLDVDYEGNKLEGLPMMDDVNGASDFTIVIDFTASADSQFWLNQAYAPYGTEIAFGLTAVKVPDAYAYYTAGQIFGIIESLKGAAQYEVLIGRPGIAVKGMDAQSLAHLLYIGLILLGNVVFFMQRGRRG
jgi:hypothetical protein